MSLDRQDVRFKLDPDMHRALAVLADVGGIGIGELCEKLVSEEVVRRVHEATLISERTARLGLTGKSRE